MCTERSPDEVVVCDVAIADVRAALAPVPGVRVTHLPYEGNLVVNAQAEQREAFRTRLAAALAPHGGSLS